MRWKVKTNKIGDKRIVKRFAIFPIEAGGSVRWLEFVMIEQILASDAYDLVWKNNRFIN